MVEKYQNEFYPDTIHDNFIQTTFLITGGTGFLGMVIVERLLRVFDVKKVYVLIRLKKDKSPEVRLAEVFANPLFRKVRELKGEEIFQKCVAIAGDAAEDNLGLSDEVRDALKREVEYVIHAAATVRFDEPLRTALLINTKGTLLMLQLAKEMQKLKCFGYISTTFCHPEEKVLEEKVYRSKHYPERLIKMLDWLDDKTFGVMAKSCLDGVPNTYTFSKALGEDLVADVMDTMPAIILRPSIVMPVWKEPLPGWSYNIATPVGFVLACGKGIVRTLCCNKDLYVDYTSVDAIADAIFVFCAHSVINSLWRTQMRILNNMKVLQYYGEREWIFINQNLINMRQLLNPRESSQYVLSCTNVDLEDYVMNLISYFRRYVLNEPVENIPLAKRRMKM
ncbi:hypothetical protein Trydic_g2366 [Trypoxylus dichotomus]